MFLSVIEWLDNNKNLIVYRYPMNGNTIKFGSKLTVRDSQVAIFVNKGVVADVFQPGMHTLSTSNLPILTKLLSLPYAFKSPFTAEVYFVNTKQFTNQKWGTSNPITMRDKEFGTVRIRGYGSYSFRVEEALTFLKELFGTNSTFETDDINQYLRSNLITCVSDAIASSKISAIDLSANLEEFSEVVKEKAKPKFSALGLKIAGFNIENISFPEEIEKAIDMRASMGVMSDKMDTFVKYQTANALRDAAKNEGSGGVGVQMGAGVAMGKVMSEAFSNSNKSNSSEESALVGKCPKCKEPLKAGSKFCSECGYKIESGFCGECGAKVAPGAKFCGECGNKIK